MDFFVIRSEIRYPSWRQSLGHHVLNGICTVIQVGVDFLILQNAIVFKALQDVCLVLRIHLVDLARTKRFLKFVVPGKTGALGFREQGKLEFLQVVVLCAIVADDFPVQHQEDLIQGIGRQVADGTPEEIVFCIQEDLPNVCQRQRSLAMELQNLQEERAGDRGFQSVQALNTAV